MKMRAYSFVVKRIAILLHTLLIVSDVLIWSISIFSLGDPDCIVWISILYDNFVKLIHWPPLFKIALFELELYVIVSSGNEKMV